MIGGFANNAKYLTEVLHEKRFFAGYQFTTLHVTDNSSSAVADLITSRDLKVGAEWDQKWSDDFASFVNFSARSLDFQPSTSANKSLSNTSKMLFSLGLGAESKISDRFNLRYSFDYSNQLFMHGLSTSSLVIDSVAVPSFSIGLNYTLLQKGKTSLGLTGSAAYLLGASTDGYSISNGSAFGGGAYLKYQYSGKELGLNVGYSQRSQNTSIIGLSEQNIFGVLTFSMPLFSEEPKK